MDVDFMLSDTYEQLRPNLELYKTFEEAVIGVDEMLAKIAISGKFAVFIRIRVLKTECFCD